MATQERYRDKDKEKDRHRDRDNDRDRDKSRDRDRVKDKEREKGKEKGRDKEGEGDGEDEVDADKIGEARLASTSCLAQNGDWSPSPDREGGLVVKEKGKLNLKKKSAQDGSKSEPTLHRAPQQPHGFLKDAKNDWMPSMLQATSQILSSRRDSATSSIIAGGESKTKTPFHHLKLHLARGHELLLRSPTFEHFSAANQRVQGYQEESAVQETYAASFFETVGQKSPFITLSDLQPISNESGREGAVPSYSLPGFQGPQDDHHSYFTFCVVSSESDNLDKSARGIPVPVQRRGPQDVAMARESQTVMNALCTIVTNARYLDEEPIKNSDHSVAENGEGKEIENGKCCLYNLGEGVRGDLVMWDTPSWWGRLKLLVLKSDLVVLFALHFEKDLKPPMTVCALADDPIIDVINNSLIVSDVYDNLGSIEETCALYCSTSFDSIVRAQWHAPAAMLANQDAILIYNEQSGQEGPAEPPVLEGSFSKKRWRKWAEVGRYLPTLKQHDQTAEMSCDFQWPSSLNAEEDNPDLGICKLQSHGRASQSIERAGDGETGGNQANALCGSKTSGSLALDNELQTSLKTVADYSAAVGHTSRQCGVLLESLEEKVAELEQMTDEHRQALQEAWKSYRRELQAVQCLNSDKEYILQHSRQTEEMLVDVTEQVTYVLNDRLDFIIMRYNTMVGTLRSGLSSHLAMVVINPLLKALLSGLAFLVGMGQSVVRRFTNERATSNQE